MTDEEVQQIRRDFPLIASAESVQADCCMGVVKGRAPSQAGLVYLDNAATMQRPRQVLDVVRDYYERKNANPLRGIYDLAVESTTELDMARLKVAEFIGAWKEEIIFTKGATESLNIIARWMEEIITADDDVIVGREAHHSNLLPWLELGRRTGAAVQIIDPDRTDGAMTVKELRRHLTPNTCLVAITGMSNVTGVIVDLEGLIAEAHRYGALVVVDAAQLVGHQLIDVAALDIDFLAFSGHKMGAPMGVGVLYGKKALLRKMPPALYGGTMVERVSLKKTMMVGETAAVRRWQTQIQWAESPQKFEAGTLDMGGIVGLATTLNYWSVEHDMPTLCGYVQDLTEELMEQLRHIDAVEWLVGENGIVSFKIKNVHPHDVAQVLNGEGIAVRAGYHCAQPLCEYMGCGACVRASLAFYNTRAEIEKLVKAVAEVPRKMNGV